MATFDFARVGFEAYNAARARRERAQREARIVRFQMEQQRLAEERLRLSRMAEERLRKADFERRTRQILEDARREQRWREEREFTEKREARLAEAEQQRIDISRQNMEIQRRYANRQTTGASTATERIAAEAKALLPDMPYEDINARIRQLEFKLRAATESLSPIEQVELIDLRKERDKRPEFARAQKIARGRELLNIGPEVPEDKVLEWMGDPSKMPKEWWQTLKDEPKSRPWWSGLK